MQLVIKGLILPKQLSLLDYSWQVHVCHVSVIVIIIVFIVLLD